MDSRLEKYIQRMYFGMYPAPGARPIFVHGSNGDNNNQGWTPDDPVLTVTQALSLATTWKGDIIYARTIGTPTNETWPISIDKADVSIVGWREEGNRSTNIVPAADTAAVSVAENNVSLIGLGFGGGTNHGAIEFATAYSSTLVKECWFGVQYGMQDGILVGSGVGDAAYLTVIDCWFGRLITRDGIRIEINATWAQLGLPGHGNRFQNVAGIGIHTTLALHEAQIYDNRFRLPSDTEGKAITLESSGTDPELCYIDGNRANYGKTEMANNPYFDGGAATNTWGLNYKGGTAVMPVIN